MTVSIIPYFISTLNYRIMDFWISFTSTLYQQIISVTGFQIFMFFSTVHLDLDLYLDVIFLVFIYFLAELSSAV